MVKYIVKRVLQAIPVLIALSIVVFLIMRVFSADPAPVVLGEHATREAMDAWRDSNGLNDPIWKQYLDFVAGALHGDLGTSYYTHTAVTTEIMSRFPPPSSSPSWPSSSPPSWASPWASSRP